MVKNAVISEPQISYVLRGWKDGRQFEQEIIPNENENDHPDRWALQECDSIDIQFHNTQIESIQIRQNPKSKHFGGYIWSSSIILSLYLHYLLVEKRLWDADAFIEVGAGCTGLPSIVLNKLGKRVIATDIPQLIPDLTRNICLNSNENDNNILAPLELEWSAKSTEKLTKSIDTILQAFEGCGITSIDGIILADCIYSQTSGESLVFTLYQLSLSCLWKFGKSPRILCVNEVRTEEARAEFLKYAHTYFSHVELVDVKKCVPSYLNEQVDCTEVYLLQKCNNISEVN